MSRGKFRWSSWFWWRWPREDVGASQNREIVTELKIKNSIRVKSPVESLARLDLEVSVVRAGCNHLRWKETQQMARLSAVKRVPRLPRLSAPRFSLSLSLLLPSPSSLPPPNDPRSIDVPTGFFFCISNGPSTIPPPIPDQPFIPSPFPFPILPSEPTLSHPTSLDNQPLSDTEEDRRPPTRPTD